MTPKITFSKTLFALINVSLLYFYSCSQDEPSLVYDPNRGGNPAPVISSIEPDSAYGARDTIIITGQNFSTSLNTNNGNHVYFDNIPGQIISASQNQLLVIPPYMGNDASVIKIDVPGAYAIGSFSPYKVKLLNPKIRGLANSDVVLTFTIDQSGNIYAVLDQQEGTSRPIVKVTPDGIKSDFGTFPYSLASDMKVGPDGSLYIQRYNNTKLYKYLSGGGNIQDSITIPRQVKYFDIDDNLNIYLGGTFNNGELYAADFSGNSKVVGNYRNVKITAVRVFDGYVYVADTVTGTIWRNQIISAVGDLGNNESYFTHPDLIGNINSIEFSNDGDLLIGTNNEDPIMIVHPDKTIKILYASYLVSPANKIIWGSGLEFYQSSRASVPDGGIYKVFYGKPGAPYYGVNPN